MFSFNKYTLLQKFLQTDMIFSYQFIVSTVRFGKCFAEFMKPINRKWAWKPSQIYQNDYSYTYIFNDFDDQNLLHNHTSEDDV